MRSRYTFGPFEIDEGARRMARGGEPFELPDRQLDILLLLVSKAGQVVSKDALIDAAWKDVAVGDNSLEQAISALRRTLGVAPDGQSWIETLARRG
jgi:DNA-binding winged helix-turn-helix (wHTH) protein